MRVLRVKNWQRYQHYKDRCPPWIKLATDTFQNYDFSRLTDASKLLAICIWTLASRSKAGEIPDDFEYLKAQGCLGPIVKPEHLKELIAQGFLEVASETLADCEQTACSETEGETEERERRGEDLSPRPPSRSAGTPIGGLEFPCDGKISAWSVTEELAARWRELFPSLDVVLECKGALAWVLAKPQRRKTARGMEAFLVGWFGRSQNRGGRPTAPAVTANDQRCDWHRKAPNRRSNYPKRGCPECKHFDAAGAGRTGSPEPIADALPSWMGAPPPAPITPEQRAEMQAGIAAIKKPKPQQPTGDTTCT